MGCKLPKKMRKEKQIYRNNTLLFLQEERKYEKKQKEREEIGEGWVGRRDIWGLDRKREVKNII